MNGGVVAFDYEHNWAVRYPELAVSVSENLATLYFQEACLYCDNTPFSPVCDLQQRALFLGMITAHIAALNAAINGQAPSPLVGRISDATEGSISVKVELNTRPGSEQWYAQTRYGYAFWTASARFRRMQYFTIPQFDPDPFDPIYPFS